MIKPYKKSCDYSYTLGFYPTFELINRRKDLLICLYIDEAGTKSEAYQKLITLVEPDKIRVSSNALEKLSDKGNDFVAGVFAKESSTLSRDTDHVVLVNPSDMGNLGNIMRSMLAFGYRDLAIITPACDEYNPKTIRASMGAFFSVNIEKFSSFEEYLAKYPRPYVPFMLQATKGLKTFKPFKEPFALVFGNEATGLPRHLLNENALIIEQSPDVDSLNLTTAVAIGLYATKR